jgi:hypothetical protein
MAFGFRGIEDAGFYNGVNSDKLRKIKVRAISFLELLLSIR